MAGAKNPQPAKLAHSLVSAHALAGNRIRLHRRGIERRRARILHRIGDGETAEPVADPVCIAGPEEDLDGGSLEEGIKFGGEGAGIWEWGY